MKQFLYEQKKTYRTKHIWKFTQIKNKLVLDYYIFVAKNKQKTNFHAKQGWFKDKHQFDAMPSILKPKIMLTLEEVPPCPVEDKIRKVVENEKTY